MRRFSLFVLLLVDLLGLAAPSHGQITEWPTTVKPGRFLLEMDALTLSLDKDGDSKYTLFGAASTFLSTGLTENWDIQLGAELFFSQKVEISGFTERNSGVGNVYVRTKWRFYDQGSTAVAVIPYIKLPTSSAAFGNDSVEGGVVVPWSTTLPGEVTMYAMAELDFLRNDADTGYDTNWYASAALSRQFTKRIGLYGEATLGKSSGGGPAEGQLGWGALFYVSDTSWWDYAMYKGIAKGSADWTHVLRFNFGF
ncbi:MAG TPA: transporter [Lacunisphaera sp.]|nr:transporter [Lacunisphaera sp.]